MEVLLDKVWLSTQVCLGLLNDNRQPISRIAQKLNPKPFFNIDAITQLYTAADAQVLVPKNFLVGGVPYLRLTTGKPTVTNISVPVPYEWTVAQQLTAKGVDIINRNEMGRLISKLGEANFLYLAAVMGIGTGVISPKKTNRIAKSPDRGVLADFIEHEKMWELYAKTKKIISDSTKQGASIDEIHERVMKFLTAKTLKHTLHPAQIMIEKFYPTITLANAYDVWRAQLPNAVAQNPQTRAMYRQLIQTAPNVFTNLPLHAEFQRELSFTRAIHQ